MVGAAAYVATVRGATHCLYWTDDEIDVLLRGTIGQTRAREVRVGIGIAQALRMGVVVVLPRNKLWQC